MKNKVFMQHMIVSVQVGWFPNPTLGYRIHKTSITKKVKAETPMGTVHKKSKQVHPLP